MYFLNLLIDTSKHFFFNVLSAKRLKPSPQKASHKTIIKVKKFRAGAVFLLIPSKCVRRSLHSGTGGGCRVDNGVHGSVGNKLLIGSLNGREDNKTQLA